MLKIYSSLYESSHLRGAPVLPIGTVNLSNGKNSLIDNALEVFNGSFAYLIKESAPTFGAGPSKWNYKMLISSGNMEKWAAGTKQHTLVHDQRRTPIGNFWEVELVVPVDSAGFSKIKSIIGKGSIAAAVFK